MTDNQDLARFGHHPDSACDFCEEVEHLESIAESKRLGLTGSGHEQECATLYERVERAMEFRVGVDPQAINAKASLRRLATMLGYDVTGEIGYAGQPMRCDPEREHLEPLRYEPALSFPNGSSGLDKALAS